MRVVQPPKGNREYQDESGNDEDIKHFIQLRNNPSNDFTPSEGISEDYHAVEENMQEYKQPQIGVHHSPGYNFTTEDHGSDERIPNDSDKLFGTMSPEDYKDKETDFNLSESYDKITLRNKTGNKYLHSTFYTPNKEVKKMKTENVEAYKGRLTQIKPNVKKSSTQNISPEPAHKQNGYRKSELKSAPLGMSMFCSSQPFEKHHPSSAYSGLNTSPFNTSNRNQRISRLNTELKGIRQKKLSIPKTHNTPGKKSDISGSGGSSSKVFEVSDFHAKFRRPMSPKSANMGVPTL